jgi:hypothetical protein
MTATDTTLSILNGTAPSWGSTLITWVVQWIPVPVRLLLLLLVSTFVVGIVEQVVSWASLTTYHPSFINSAGKRIGGWWTHGTKY